MSLPQNSEISLHSIALEVFEASVILFFCKQSVFCLKIWDFFFLSWEFRNNPRRDLKQEQETHNAVSGGRAFQAKKLQIK